STAPGSGAAEPQPADTDKAAAGESKTDPKGESKAAGKAPAVRAVIVTAPEWTEDGRRAAVQIRTVDNKDRWLATVDLDGFRLVSRHRLTDNAWVTWDHGDFGWLRDNTTLYFLSEESGYSHLYTASARDGAIRQLTRGKFEVGGLVPSRDGRYIYYRANLSHPGQYDIWRVATETGKAEQLTHLGGLTDFRLSLDEGQLLLDHSTIAHHDELYVQPNRPGAEALQITDTLSAAYRAKDWVLPDIVPVPSSHGDAPIYARVYTPRGFDPHAAAKNPAVVFIHGAGYLQDAHYGWSYYLHEFMFSTLLTEHGYVVMDMDYRGSAGYGRDWRTAIYRQMGHPELEDLADGVRWLALYKNVDPRRVGAYGGSYGGFLTLMALFRDPHLFAAGAALRPVTDWAHYNDEYTSAILNTPAIDPQAYERSSPIEFAAGLDRPLLICHGVEDDNVFFQDTVRLVQRLIELGKEDFETAIYPVEPHGFTRASSWLDEYRRIWKLFESHLRVPGATAN
ncbi:MAG: prolyl oligopeptidase family serine peptidase, partial [Acidobacteriota bacterium]|nr:prolyl oligopeptidase family serine peptidase [Acidobacteriota bacterium]